MLCSKHLRSFNSLPNDKFVDCSKLKVCADDKINKTEKLKFVLGMGENIVGKGENAGHQHFLLSPECFQKASLYRSLKVGVQYGKELKQFCCSSTVIEVSMIFYMIGTTKSWEQYSRIPVCTLKTAFSRFLDITTPPSQTLLKLLAAQATKDCDRESLENLANVSLFAQPFPKRQILDSSKLKEFADNNF